jgi:hypothetical protein
MTIGRAPALSDSVPSLIVPINCRIDPALAGFLGIRLMVGYLLRRSDHCPPTAVMRCQVSRETMLALTAAASWSTSAADVSKAVIHRTMQLPLSPSDHTWMLKSFSS